MEAATTDENRLRRIVVLSGLSFATQALCLVMPGALLPLLLERFTMRLVEAGALLALQPVGHLLSVMVAPRVIARLGAPAALRAAFMLPAVGFLGFGFAATWPVGAAMMFVTGLGIGTIEVTVNTLVITASGTRSTSMLNLTHLFFGVGSILVPVIATQAVAAGMTWAGLCTLTCVINLSVGLAWGTLRNGTAAAATDGRAPEPLQWGLLAVLAATLAVYVGAEMGIGSWLTKFMMSEHGSSLTSAGNVLSLYWFGLTAGRFVLGLTAHRFSDERLLLGLTALATVSAVAAQTASSAAVSALGFVATGLGFSGIFPAVIAIGGRSHPSATARATSVMVGGAGLGQIVLPWLMSAVAERAGLRLGMALYALLAAVLVGLSALIFRRARRRGGASLAKRA